MPNIKKLLGVSALAAFLAACGSESAAPAAPETPSAVQQNNNASEALTASDLHTAPDGVDHDHNTMNSLDWAGKYVGQLPCASCDHILTTVELKQDGTFRYTADYQGGKEPLIVEKQGRFEWDDQGSIVELDLEAEEDLRFFVAEGHLQQLATDQDQYQPDSRYNLQKQ